MKNSNSYEISTDQGRLDINLIYDFLKATPWARDIPRSVVERSIQNSLCFGIFFDRRQVGFGRIISDFATFAYIADIFILPEHRGRGVCKLLLRAMLDHPDLQGLRRILLATQDAQGLYARFGFQPLAHAEHYMTIHKPDVYHPAPKSAS